MMHLCVCVYVCVYASVTYDWDIVSLWHHIASSCELLVRPHLAGWNLCADVCGRYLNMWYVKAVEECAEAVMTS